MYACNLETERGYFEGVCAPCNATAHFSAPHFLTIRKLLSSSGAAGRIRYFTSERFPFWSLINRSVSAASREKFTILTMWHMKHIHVADVSTLVPL
jgi:hypothetical protein